MGNEENKNLKLMFSYDGVNYANITKIENLTSEMISSEDKESNIHISDLSAEMNVVFDGITFRNCRNRKRFIKLLMSQGINRNTASQYADALSKILPYKIAWLLFKPPLI